MPDLAAQIRERLDELAAPQLPPQFLPAPDGLSPEEIAAWQKAYDELTIGAPVRPVVMLPHGAKWEPLPDPRNAAILAVLDAADADSQWAVHCIAKALGIEVTGE